MTSTQTREVHTPITVQRLAFVERQILRATVDQSGVEWFEQLHSLRARGALLGGAEKWDRVLRFIEGRLDAGSHSNREIVIMALAKFKEAVDFPRV